MRVRPLRPGYPVRVVAHPLLTQSLETLYTLNDEQCLIYSTATTAAAAASTPTAGPEASMEAAAPVEGVAPADEPLAVPDAPPLAPVEDPMVEELAGEPGTPLKEPEGPAAPGPEGEPEGEA